MATTISSYALDTWGGEALPASITCERSARGLSLGVRGTSARPADHERALDLIGRALGSTLLEPVGVGLAITMCLGEEGRGPVDWRSLLLPAVVAGAIESGQLRQLDCSTGDWVMPDIAGATCVGGLIECDDGSVVPEAPWGTRLFDDAAERDGVTLVRPIDPIQDRDWHPRGDVRFLLDLGELCGDWLGIDSLVRPDTPGLDLGGWLGGMLREGDAHDVGGHGDDLGMGVAMVRTRGRHR